MNRRAHRLDTTLPKPRPHKLSAANAAVFAAAVQHHQAGHLHEAEPLYRQVLTLNPVHADSLHLLGVLALQVGRHDLAADLIGQAIGIDATIALYHTNLGNALKALDRLDESIACYRRAITLKPRYPEAYNNLAAALLAQNGPDEAAACLRKAVELRPDLPDAHNNLGNLLVDLGRPDEAVACYRRSVALRPDYPEAHNNLGAALRELGRLDEAILCYRKALAFQPNFAAAHNNLGIVLRRLGRLDEAVACCRGAIALKTDMPDAHDALGTALADQGKLDEAAACYQQALALRPDHPLAHDNLGTVRKEQGRLDDAIDCFRTATALRPEFPNAHHNLAIALLARGDMAEGWLEYEWRWRTAALAPFRRDFPQPRWRGEPAEGRTLLIHAEQGLGDSIQFCRYASLAAARGLHVVMEVQKPLVRLLRALPDVDRIVTRGEEPLPSFDLHCPMQSLPLAFATTIATIPSARSYLRADRAQAAAWQARLDAVGRPGLRVGLAWAGNPAMIRDHQRSLAPHQLAPLFPLPGVHFVSLQKDGPRAAPDAPITDFMAEMEDFAETAALIAALDLVISVDTAVAHLAAALGKPVWLLDRFDPDWRWLLGRRDSPWYPSLRLYRQPRPGSWDEILAEVTSDLRDFAGTMARRSATADPASPSATLVELARPPTW
jgi:tetratricopeptide (TPR) repeat protein